MGPLLWPKLQKIIYSFWSPHFVYSTGNIYVLFSKIPNDYKTWYYLVLSPNGPSWYHAMKLKQRDSQNEDSRTAGDASLYESFFVCLKEKSNGKMKMDFGKSDSNYITGADSTETLLGSYDFADEHNALDKISYYTFGAGDAKVSLYVFIKVYMYL